MEILRCEYCNNEFDNNSSLFKHKRIAKYCLILQGKIEDTRTKKKAEKEEKEKEEKEKKEKEKEKTRENKFRCEYCGVRLTSRINYCGHVDICLVKYKKIIEEKDKIIQEKELEKEKIINKNKLEKENKKIKENNPNILSTRKMGSTPKGPASSKSTALQPVAELSNKPLVLNDMIIEVDPVSLMINATQMCKAAGKLFSNYKQLDGTKDFMRVLNSVAGIPATELIKVTQGGNSKEQGTFVHRLVAVHLAQWLSPSFAVQVTLWVKSLDSSTAALRVKDDISLLINENKILNSVNNKLYIENEKIKENSLAIAPKKPLVLNDIMIDVDPVSLMINATQMCKAAGKLFANYKQLDGTKDYLQTLESIIGIPIIELVKVDVGGNHSGTFVHRLVAVHLAQWLSPSFAVQVSLLVKSLDREAAALRVEDDNDLLIIENKRLNSINNILYIENKKIKETSLAIAPKKPLVLNDMIIEVDPVSLMINATQMCKAAGKKWSHYVQLDGTKDFLRALESKAVITALEIIKAEHGGNHSGTWVHRLVAVHLAQWLSPSFAVQVSLWVKSIDREAVEEHNDLLINENKILNSMNNKLEKENKKIKENILAIAPNKPLVLNNITIEVDPVSLMINATQMCQAAGKKWNNYFKLDGTKDYLQALNSVALIRATELIKVTQGGNSKEQGTFVHRLVAVHLAQWLSPSFAVQVSLWVSELMITGKVEIGNGLSNEAIIDKWRLKLMEENNRCKDLELKINCIEEDKIKKEEYDKKKIIDELNTTISVFSTETKSNLTFHEEKEVIYLGYIGNFLFKYGQSSNFKDRLGHHEKSTSYEKFEIVKVFACKNPVVSERRVREWVRKNKLEYEYKPDGEKNQREIIKIESKEMLEKVTKAMQKYSNMNVNKNTDLYNSEEVDYRAAALQVEIKRIEADKEVEIKRIEVAIKKTEAEVEIKRMNLLSEGKITFDQYIQLRNLK